MAGGPGMIIERGDLDSPDVAALPHGAALPKAQNCRFYIHLEQLLAGVEEPLRLLACANRSLSVLRQPQDRAIIQP